MNEDPTLSDSTNDDIGREGREGSRFPTPFQDRTLWTAKTALSIVVIGAIAVGLIWLLGFVLSYLQPVLVPLAIAGIIAYLLIPICEKLTDRGMKYSKAMLLVYASFFIGMFILAVMVLVPAIGQGSELYGDRAAIRDRVVERLEGAEDYISQAFGGEKKSEYMVDKAKVWLEENGPNMAKSMGGWFWNRLRGAFGFLGYAVGLFLVPIYLYYFLKESHAISTQWSDYLPLRTSKFKEEVVATLTEINGYLIAFFRGQMLVSMIDGVLVGVGLSLIGLPYAPVIGVFVALLGLIPYIGNLLCLIPAVLIAIAHFGHDEVVDITGKSVEVGQKIEAPIAVGQVAEPALSVEKEGQMSLDMNREQVVNVGEKRMVEGVVKEVDEKKNTARVLMNAWKWLPYPWAYPLIVVALFFILQQINSLWTAPRIVGDSVGLHPLTVIFSVLFWSLVLGGLLGALLAVPLTASVKVLLRRYVWERKMKPEVVAGPEGLADEV